MWRPHDIRMSMRSDDVVLERLNYYDEDKGPALLWSVIRSMFNYPLSNLMDDVSFVSASICSNSEMPFRAHTKKPIWHPTLEGFRLCPNFPELCVNKAGDVFLVEIPKNDPKKTYFHTPCVFFGQLGAYYPTRIPGREVPQFVSLVQIYGDAWSADGSPTVEMYTYVPQNGVPTDLRPENIRLAPRWSTRHYKKWSDGKIADYQGFSLCDGLTSMPSLEQFDLLKKNAITPDIARFNEYDCFYTDTPIKNNKRAVWKNRYSNNCDWYFNQYWALCYINWKTMEIVTFTTMIAAMTYLGWPKQAVRWKLKHNRPDDEFSLFLL